MRVRMFAPVGAPQTIDWENNLRDEGIDVDVIGVPSSSSGGLGQLIDLAVRTRQRSEKADATIIHSLGAHGLLALLGGTTGKVTVVPWGTEVLRARKHPLRHLVAARLLQLADRVIVSSSDMSTLLESHWRSAARGKVHVVSWGANVEMFTRRVPTSEQAAIRHCFGCSSDDIVIVSPRGRKPLYRPITIRNAFLKARKTRPNLKLIEVGHRVDRSDDSRANGIVSAGWLTKEELAQLFAISDMVVSVPEHDQRATVVVEAIASGTVVFLSGLDSYRELRRDGADVIISGSLVELALQEALEQIDSRISSRNEANIAWAVANENRVLQFREIIRIATGPTTDRGNSH